MATIQSEREYLESRGWKQLSRVTGGDRYPSWNWVQPKTGARFQLKDALDCQHGLDKEKGRADGDNHQSKGRQKD